MRYILVVAMALLSTGTGHAVTGSDLYDQCIKEPKGSNHEVACIAFIRGVLEGFQLAQLMSRAGISTCQPPFLTVDQARPVIEKYMKDNPADLYIGAAAIALTALMVAYPCPKKSN